MSPSPESQPTDSRDWTTIGSLLVILALALSTFSWVMASPVGGSPDEPAHVAYAWGLATGQGAGGTDEGCELDDSCAVSLYEFPVGLVPEPGCYAFNPAVSAECAVPARDHLRVTMTRYPPAYYLATGYTMRIAHGLGASPENSSLIGRFAGAAICTTLVAMALYATRRNAAITAAALIAVTPMAMFMFGSVNPTGTEIAGAIASAALLAGLTVHSSRRYQVGFVIAFFWLASSRPVGWLWAGLLFSMALVMIWRMAEASDRFRLAHWRHFSVLLGGSALCVLSSTAWFLYAIQVRNTANETGATLPADEVRRWLAILLRWGGMMSEIAGDLGWLDTRVPSLLIYILVGCIGAAIAIAVMSQRDRFHYRLVAGYTAAVVVGTMLIEDRQSFLWQGRYVLPPLAIAVIVLVGKTPAPSHRKLLAAGQLAWASASLGALWLCARYAWGIESGARNRTPIFDVPAAWAPQIGLIGILVCTMLAIAAGVLGQGVLKRAVPVSQHSPRETTESVSDKPLGNSHDAPTQVPLS